MPLASHPRAPDKRPCIPSARLSAVGCWVLLALSLALSACGRPVEDKETQAREAAYKEKYAKAKALFEERCKTAGVVVKRTVKDVEGIELIKVRPKLEWWDKAYFDPMFEGAAMADEAQGDSYIASFLYWEFRNPHTPDRRGVIKPPGTKPGLNEEAPRMGYRYVDVRDQSGYQRWRYQAVRGLRDPEWLARASWAEDLERSPQSGKPAPFAIDYEDIVDPADRAYWVAGTRIKIIDQSNGEVIAQLTRYVWDPGFGGSTTGRWPWQHASSVGPDRVCPHDWGTRERVTRFFVDTILIPQQAEER